MSVENLATDGKPTKPVRVISPCRLHFGLLRFRAKQPGERSFGGLGMMVAEPRVSVQAERSGEWTAEGPHAERALKYAKLTAEHLKDRSPLEIQVLAAPPQHVGLGLGTQLALCTAAAVHQALGRAEPATDVLSEITGRGSRSAVGAYGFERGGLILENGSVEQGSLGEFVAGVVFPDAWRVLLITLPTTSGVHGTAEQRAFNQVPRVAPATTSRLWELATEQILPAARANVFDEFSDGVYEYGHRAGECFTAVQGGAYASEQIAAVVARLRSMGVRGVGQSSWGPTVYAFVEDQTAANQLVERIEDLPEFARASIRITQADNRGRVLSCG